MHSRYLGDVMSNPSHANPSKLVRFFGAVERWGQKLPDPLTLFAIMAGLVIVVSAAFVGTSAEVVQRTGDVVNLSVKSLLTFEGIRWMLLSAVDNFIQFAPLGPVLTVMIGIGVAERTGFISMGLKVLVTKVPASLLTATVVFAGVMSSMAADAGYVVLTPLGALLFASVKRHPMAGLAAAYAGVSGGFSANLLITGLDPMLQPSLNRRPNPLTQHIRSTRHATLISWWHRSASLHFSARSSHPKLSSRCSANGIPHRATGLSMREVERQALRRAVPSAYRPL